MTPEDEAKIVALMRAARAKARGYSDFFLWSIDRDMEEWGVVTSLAESLEKDAALFFSKLQRRGRPNDPPDCEAIDDSGARIAIEVTELVDGQAIQSYKAGAIYDWAEWDKKKFLSGVDRAIKAKDSRYPNLKGGPYQGGYVVVVHTDEPLLNFETVRRFLEYYDLARPQNISRAFLLLSYDPAQNRCPYFELRFNG